MGNSLCKRKYQEEDANERKTDCVVEYCGSWGYYAKYADFRMIFEEDFDEEGYTIRGKGTILKKKLYYYIIINVFK